MCPPSTHSPESTHHGLDASSAFIDSIDVNPSNDTLSDRALGDRILTGLHASEELQSRFRRSLEAFLVGMCDRGDGRSREKAVEIVSQILADCFTKSPSLLERWQGNDNLDAFLKTAALNRLKSWWSSAERQRLQIDSETVAAARDSVPPHELEVHDDELFMADQSLRAGVDAAARDCPEGLVFLRLKGLHGVDQRAISTCWGHHEAQTSRKIKDAMGRIRKSAKEKADDLGLELSMEILQQALQRTPSILLGRIGAPVGAAEDACLRRLAAGTASPAERGRAVDLMCGNPQALEYFARILNQAAREMVVARDPALAGFGVRIEECVRRNLSIMRPDEAGSLVTPMMREALRDAIQTVGADAGSLWLLCPGEAMLQAAYSPSEPHIEGMRQPLASGIISLVIATGEPCFVNDVEKHRSHSPAIDIVMGKQTRSMLAVPFCPAGTPRGVITAVSFAMGDGFTPEHSAVFERHGRVFGELFAANLAKRVCS